MKAQDFLDWAEKTSMRFAADFIRATGVSRPVAEEIYKAAKSGRHVPIKRQLALAMSAIAAGLGPWGETGESNDNE